MVAWPAWCSKSSSNAQTPGAVRFGGQDYRHQHEPRRAKPLGQAQAQQPCAVRASATLRGAWSRSGRTGRPERCGLGHALRVGHNRIIGRADVSGARRCHRHAGVQRERKGRHRQHRKPLHGSPPIKVLA
jgi:hypothetical protein